MISSRLVQRASRVHPLHALTRSLPHLPATRLTPTVFQKKCFSASAFRNIDFLKDFIKQPDSALNAKDSRASQDAAHSQRKRSEQSENGCKKARLGPQQPADGSTQLHWHNATNLTKPFTTYEYQQDRLGAIRARQAKETGFQTLDDLKLHEDIITKLEALETDTAAKVETLKIDRQKPIDLAKIVSYYKDNKRNIERVSADTKELEKQMKKIDSHIVAGTAVRNAKQISELKEKMAELESLKLGSNENVGTLHAELAEKLAALDSSHQRVTGNIDVLYDGQTETLKKVDACGEATKHLLKQFAATKEKVVVYEEETRRLSAQNERMEEKIAALEPSKEILDEIDRVKEETVKGQGDHKMLKRRVVELETKVDDLVLGDSHVGNATISLISKLEHAHGDLVKEVEGLAAAQAQSEKREASKVNSNSDTPYSYISQKVNGLEAAQRSIIEDIREIAQRTGQHYDNEKFASQQADIDNLWGHIQYIQHAVSEFRAWQEKELKKTTSSFFESGEPETKDVSTLKNKLRNEIQSLKSDYVADGAALQASFNKLCTDLMAEKIQQEEKERNRVALDRATVENMIEKAVESVREEFEDALFDLDPRKVDEIESALKTMRKELENLRTKESSVTDAKLQQLDEAVKALHTDLQENIEARVSKAVGSVLDDVEQMFNTSLKDVEAKHAVDIKQLQKDNAELAIKNSEVMRGRLPEKEWYSSTEAHPTKRAKPEREEKTEASEKGGIFAGLKAVNKFIEEMTLLQIGVTMVVVALWLTILNEFRVMGAHSYDLVAPYIRELARNVGHMVSWSRTSVTPATRETDYNAKGEERISNAKDEGHVFKGNAMNEVNSPPAEDKEQVSGRDIYWQGTWDTSEGKFKWEKKP